MKSPLLQAPLPVMRKPLPDIKIVKGMSSSHPHFMVVSGIGEAPIPFMVADAIAELDQNGMWQEMGYHCIGKMSQPDIVPRLDIAVLALMLRYNELNYVESAKC